MVELTLTATPPTYETILELDHKVREKVLPPSLNVYTSSIDEYTTPTSYARGRILFQFRTTSMVFNFEVCFLHSPQCLSNVVHTPQFLRPGSARFSFKSPSQPLRALLSCWLPMCFGNHKDYCSNFPEISRFVFSLLDALEQSIIRCS